VLAGPVGIGFQMTLSLFLTPKSFHVKTEPPCEQLFYNSSRGKERSGFNPLFFWGGDFSIKKAADPKKSAVMTENVTFDAR
jgi:hypothetical protein